MKLFKHSTMMMVLAGFRRFFLLIFAEDQPAGICGVLKLLKNQRDQPLQHRFYRSLKNVHVNDKPGWITGTEIPVFFTAPGITEPAPGIALKNDRDGHRKMYRFLPEVAG